MTKIKGKGGPTAPLDEYQLDDIWWQRGNVKTGEPFVGGGSHKSTAYPVVVKQWQRQTAVDDQILREIWRDEVRQLNRLKGLPKASLYLATLRSAFEDSKAFTLILDCGDRVPLAHHIKYSGTRTWCSAPRALQNRIRLWREVTRLAIAIGILHAQGLIHRNIDEWSVMTSGAPNADFILTGFEWSMRLSSKMTARSGMKSPIHSFYEDWRALGNLIAWILRIPSISKADQRYRADPNADTDFLTAPERDFLRTLIAADPLVRLDSEVAVDLLEKILVNLEHQKLGVETDLILALPLDSQQALSRAIRDISDQTIALVDYDAQRQFIADAISESPRLVKIKARSGEEPTYRISSPKLTLELRPFSPYRGGDPTWSMASGIRLLSDRPALAEIDQDVSLEGWGIEIIDFGEARKRAPKVQGRATRWTDIFEASQPSASTVAMERPSFSGLMLLQVADILWKASQIWPVRRVSLEGDATGLRLTVEGRDDPRLSQLSKALCLEPPTARLLAGVQNETLRLDGEWQLSSELGLGRVRSRASTWRFVEMQKTDGRTNYVFESSAGRGALDIESELYFQVDGAGYDALVERRLSALKVLREHSELLDMLEDPAGDIRLSHDDPEQISQLEVGLDQSKIAALREAWEQLPLYLVQGPPGVGKTRLIRAIVAGRLAGSPMDRILLSAQNHSTVDHLLEEVKKAIDALPQSEASEIFPLRCRALGAEAKTDWDRENQARRISTALSNSILAKSASPGIRKKIRNLRRIYEASSELSLEEADTDAGAGPKIDRSFESLLLRSANLVFSSTNSGDLARLLDEGAQFDWSMMEESAKATGIELIAPLMLSYRRLMIGDHAQLPAFDTGRLTELLSFPSRIQEGLAAGAQIIAPVFRKLDLEDALDWLSENTDARVCAEANRMLTIFETLIVPNVIDANRKPGKRAIGRQLLIQHRMHPVIGELISETFYEGKVTTFPSVSENYRFQPPPVYSRDASRLPDEPIVFVDMPYVQTTVGMKLPEAKPSWTNLQEAAVCREVLRLLRARDGEQPSLAVLSPYRRQVQLLRRTVEEASSGLNNLMDFSAKTDDGFFGTVDSFQGNEADIVVVSLVRNNHRTGTSALGFLSESQRMNVLLSRAKWRLIVIGSLDFLRTCIPPHDALQTSDPLSFLDRLLRFIAPRNGSMKPGIAIVPHLNFQGDGK